MRFSVNIQTTCEMIVEVEAETAAEAKRLARRADYTPVTEWSPLSYDKLRAVYAREEGSDG